MHALATDPECSQKWLHNSLHILSTKILPGVRVIIVNPETRGPLGDSHLGEVSFMY